MTARRWLIAGAAVMAVGMAFAGVESLNKGVAVAAAPGDVGAVVDNFRLTDQHLNSHELHQLTDTKAVVLITQGNGCPINRNTGVAMNALYDQFSSQGVEFFMLNSNIQDNREDIAEEAAEFGFKMPVLKDEYQLVGEQLAVTRTAEVFVIDPKTWRIVYRGPVDDRVTYERQKARAEHTWAADALQAHISGREIAVKQQAAPGCLINLLEAGKRDLHQQISYSETIAPLIRDNCANCHQEGGIGPIELTDYQDVLGHSAMIREVLRTDRMPPYHADPHVNSFDNDYNLAADEIKTLVHWIEAGSPRGAGPDVLAQTEFVVPEWPLGEPDVVLTVPAYTIPATGVVDYQRPWTPYPITEGRWLRASTVKVGERQGVHHVLTGYMTEAPTASQTTESRWGASVGGYAVGAESTVAPLDAGTWLPGGGAVGFQMHYTPFGRESVDQTQIALYFYDEGQTPTYVMRGATIADVTITIPPGADNHQEVAYMSFPRDAILYSAFPHAHYRGRSSKVEIMYPDGRRELLLALPKYDFNWQRSYDFETPVRIPAGSKIIATYTYDNSVRNPANPDPTKTITWGDQSFEEMLFTALRYRWVEETSSNQVTYDNLLNADRMFGLLDDNIDGKIQLAELKGGIGAPLRAAFAVLDRDGDGALNAAEAAAAQGGGGALGRRAER